MNDDTVPPVPLSTYRRILNFVRFWLYVRANITVVLANQGAMATALNNAAAHITRLNARLDWYEHQVPLLGKAGASFRAHERNLMQKAEAQVNYAEREKRRATDSEAIPAPSAPKLEVVSR